MPGGSRKGRGSLLLALPEYAEDVAEARRLED